MAEPVTDDLLARYLGANDAPCPACGYNLRGARSDRCPECGEQIRLTIAPKRCATRAWRLAAIFGVCASILLSAGLLVPLLHGVNNLLRTPQLYSFVEHGYVSSTELPRWVQIISLLILIAGQSILLAWLIAARQLFARFTRRMQAIIGLALAAMPLIVLGILIIIVWLT